MIPNLSKDMIDVMQILRKALNAEFNLSLKLSQPDVVDQIQLWAGKSQKKENQVLCGSLENLMGISPLKIHVIDPQAQSTPSKTRKRVYRGQVIEESVSNSPVSDQAPVKAKRMYRGQVVS